MQTHSYILQSSDFTKTLSTAANKRKTNIFKKLFFQLNQLFFCYKFVPYKTLGPISHASNVSGFPKLKPAQYYVHFSVNDESHINHNESIRIEN